MADAPLPYTFITNDPTGPDVYDLDPTKAAEPYTLIPGDQVVIDGEPVHANTAVVGGEVLDDPPKDYRPGLHATPITWCQDQPTSFILYHHRVDQMLIETTGGHVYRSYVHATYVSEAVRLASGDFLTIDTYTNYLIRVAMRDELAGEMERPT